MRTFAWLVLLAGCQTGLEDGRAQPPLDEPFFHCRVQPVLTKLCAGLACHGAGDRYFKLFARNRLRLGGSEDERNAFLRESERAFNFDAARAQVDPDDPAKSLLLLKGLDEAAEGYFHRGAEIFGRGDVFTSEDDPDYRTLRDWVHGATEDPSCSEPGSDQ